MTRQEEIRGFGFCLFVCFPLDRVQERRQVRELWVNSERTHSTRAGTSLHTFGDMYVTTYVTLEIALRTFGCF